VARTRGSFRVGLVVFGLVLPVVAATGTPLPATAEPFEEWTVVTLARDGSWGAGTADTQSAAIAAALRKCNAMSGQRSDCGAEFTAIKNGWTIGLLCGDHRALAASTDRVATEQAAEARRSYLATLYGADLPPCRRVLTVDPEGFVIAPKVDGPKAASISRDATP
jgi:hypothetical protein